MVTWVAGEGNRDPWGLVGRTSKGFNKGHFHIGSGAPNHTGCALCAMPCGAAARSKAGTEGGTGLGSSSLGKSPSDLSRCACIRFGRRGMSIHSSILNG